MEDGESTHNVTPKDATPTSLTTKRHLLSISHLQLRDEAIEEKSSGEKKNKEKRKKTKKERSRGEENESTARRKKKDRSEGKRRRELLAAGSDLSNDAFTATMADSYLSREEDLVEHDFSVVISVSRPHPKRKREVVSGKLELGPGAVSEPDDDSIALPKQNKKRRKNQNGVKSLSFREKSLLSNSSRQSPEGISSNGDFSDDCDDFLPSGGSDTSRRKRGGKIRSDSRQVRRLLSERLPPMDIPFVNGHRSATNEKKTGFFSPNEIRIMEDHKHDFCHIHLVDGDTFDRIVQFGYHDTKRNFPVDQSVTTFREFWKEIYDLLPDRDRRSVNRFMRRRFVPPGLESMSQRHRWSGEQDRELLRLHKEHGPKWATIAKEIGRSYDEVTQRWKNHLEHRHKMNRGLWTPDEIENLISALRDARVEVVQAGRDVGRDIYELPESEIKWGKISDSMDNIRSRQQCADKWRRIRAAVLRRREAGEPDAIYRYGMEQTPRSTNEIQRKLLSRRSTTPYITEHSSLGDDINGSVSAHSPSESEDEPSTQLKMESLTQFSVKADSRVEISKVGNSLPSAAQRTVSRKVARSSPLPSPCKTDKSSRDSSEGKSIDEEEENDEISTTPESLRSRSVARSGSGSVGESTGSDIPFATHQGSNIPSSDNEDSDHSEREESENSDGIIAPFVQKSLNQAYGYLVDREAEESSINEPEVSSKSDFVIKSESESSSGVELASRVKRVKENLQLPSRLVRYSKWEGKIKIESP